MTTEHCLLWYDDFGFFSIINVNTIFIQYRKIICICKFYSTKQRIVYSWYWIHFVWWGPQFMCKFHTFKRRHGVVVGNGEKMLDFLPNEIFGLFEWSNFWRCTSVVDPIWLLVKYDSIWVEVRWFDSAVVHFVCFCAYAWFFMVGGSILLSWR